MLCLHENPVYIFNKFQSGSNVGISDFLKLNNQSYPPIDVHVFTPTVGQTPNQSTEIIQIKQKKKRLKHGTTYGGLTVLWLTFT